MLKKIQNVWSFILKKKKVTNAVNMYNFKNNVLLTNAISSSLVFFISATSTIKLKNIRTNWCRKSSATYSSFFLITFVIAVSSFLFFLLLVL